MVALFQNIREMTDVLTIENVTVFGIMIAIIIFLIYERNKIDLRHEKEKDRLQSIIKDAQSELRSEFKETNLDLKQIAEKYHIFTVQVFEKLKSIINTKE